MAKISQYTKTERKMMEEAKLKASQPVEEKTEVKKTVKKVKKAKK